MAWSSAANGKAVEGEIVALGRAEDRSFLKRAAVLHADVAAYADLHPRPNTERPRPTRLPGGDPVPPLLMGEPVILNK
ncbi:MAG TPA: hypothetical protein VF147_13075, partial [Vicinamibacterales bacterium]